MPSLKLHLQRPATSGPGLRRLPVIDELRAVEPEHGRARSRQLLDHVNRRRAASNGSRGQPIWSKCTQVTDEVAGGILQLPLDWDRLPSLRRVENRQVVNRRQEAYEDVLHPLVVASCRAARRGARRVEVAVPAVDRRDRVVARG